MGILDDAIRDHLDLKRRRGAEEPELKRLEDEAFGPQGRPDASGAPGPTASALAEAPAESRAREITPEDLGLESLSEETPPPDEPAPEEPSPADEPSGGTDAEPSASGGGGIAFHDFAAEEGLVSSGPAPPGPGPPEPSDPVERALAQPTPEQSAETAPAEAEAAEPEAEATEVQRADEIKPADEASAPGGEDTQVHDMAKELELEPDEASSAEGTPPAESAESEAGGDEEPALELDVEGLDIELDEETDAGEAEGAEDEDEDVLEETPEFLRDAPESDRLWFEQGKPKDFDFDED
jgi:hypothetical protein